MAERVRLLRTIRLDESDRFVFANAGESGQWAVPGGFLFDGADPQALSPKQRIALRSGWLGLADFGWSSLVTVVEATEEEREEAVELLARGFVARLGAPHLEAAREAAREEIAFAQSLAEHESGTLIALHRTLDDGEIREQFRTLHKRAVPVGGDRLHAHARAFTIVETDEDDEPAERVDLATLIPFPVKGKK